MQEKKNIDNMAEKYKEEMMRIYNTKHPAPQPKPVPAKPAPAVPAKEEVYICEPNGDPLGSAVPEQEPMSAPEVSAPEADCKFPTAEELMKLDCGVCEETDEAVPTMNLTSDTRFDSGENCHMQGNYDSYTEEESGCGSCAEDFQEEKHSGKGYIQAEVTCDGEPVAGAAVAILKKVWDSDILIAILATDSNGMTEAIPLPITADDGKPYEKYMITVYKEEHYSVNMLPVPVFDTIKSIQPVEMTKAGKEC